MLGVIFGVVLVGIFCVGSASAVGNVDGQGSIGSGSGIDSLLTDADSDSLSAREEANQKHFLKANKFAKTGNPNALGELGYLYYKGIGTPVDVGLAEKYIDESVRRGSGIGEYYKCSLLADKNKMNEAIPLCESAASKGVGQAYVSLGWFYMSDRYGVLDYKKAVEYAKAAIDKYSLPEAKANLAYLYETGNGVDKSYDKAFLLYKDVVNGGPHSPQAEFQIAGMYFDGRGVARDYGKAEFYYKKVLHPDAKWSGWDITREQIETSRSRLSIINR